MRLAMPIHVCSYDEIAEFLGHAPVHVVSIRDPERERPAAIAAMHPESITDVLFHDKTEPTEGHLLPTAEDVDRLIALGRRLPADGVVLVHCTMGISRSTATMAILLAAQDPGRSATDIFEEVLQVRPIAWPSSLMIRLADERLGREGELIKALHSVLERQVMARPDTASLIGSVGRQAEVDAARSRAALVRDADPT
jgi:predicted protein tyrosine phosphatase